MSTTAATKRSHDDRTARALASAADAILAEYKILSDATSNPAWALLAHRVARQGGVPIPGWAAAGVDALSERFVYLSAPPAEDAAATAAPYTKKLTALFGADERALEARGGPQDTFERCKAEYEQYLIAIRVRVRRAEGYAPTASYAKVAEDIGLPVVQTRRIRDAWKRFGKFVEAGSLEEQIRDVRAMP